MKRFPGKIVMVLIILSCGFVMQAEQSERAQLKQGNPEVVKPEPPSQVVAAQRRVALPAQREAW